MIVVYYIALTLFLLLCVLMCAVIMMQESKMQGLGSSFGGSAGESLFGTATADVLKRFTAWLAVIFLGSCIVLSWWTQGVGPAPLSIGPPVIEQNQLP